MMDYLPKIAPQKMPLFGVLIIPFVLLIILIVGMVGYVSFVNGQQAVNYVAYELRDEITQRIRDHLLLFLQLPHQITISNLREILSDQQNENFSQELAANFLETVKVFPTISSTYFGNTGGGIVGSGREGSQGLLYVYSTENQNAGVFTKFRIDDEGIYHEKLASVDNYDARLRPWYKAAVEKQSATWSDIYILTTGQDMAIAASRPVYDSNHLLVGVTSVDIFLSQLDSFLKDLYFSEGGESFIIERNGMLVATSTDEKPFQFNEQTGKLTRTYANQSQTPIIQQTAHFLEEKFNNYTQIPEANLDMQYVTSGKKTFVELAPLKDGYGIDWMIVVVVPEEDFMGKIRANNRMTGFIILGALLVGIAVSVLTGGLIARRIYRVSEAARALAEGKWDDAVAASSTIIEIDILSRSYNQMARQLHHMLENLSREVDERKNAERSLRESEDRYRTLVENVPVGVFRASPEGRLLAGNSALFRLLGIDPDQDLNQFTLGAVFAHNADRDFFTDQIVHDAKILKHEFEFVKTNGQMFWGAITARPVLALYNTGDYPTSEITFIDGVLEDISERKVVEEFTQKTLREKEVLLQELYHRTKNNMQVINSLLAMQASELNDERINGIFQNLENRIQAMSLVHEKLYKSKNLSSIDLQDYVQDLARQLVFSYRISSSQIKLNLDIEEILMTLDVAIPCGLILNELITNALKYAFPLGAAGSILVQIRQSDVGILEVKVTDDGVGLPESSNGKMPRKLGLATVYSIVEHQLRGTIQVDSQQGVSWLIYFPYQQYSPRI